MSFHPSVYNPRDTDPKLLDELLTGRTPLLEEILANLREQVGGTTRQHWLLRGQRGMGKTHLSGVIYHRVKNDPELQKVYLPLWLGEADVYEVYSAGTLLVKIVERLAEEAQEKEVLQRSRALEGVGDEESFFEAMLELLSGEARRRERVLLVLMENMDALLDSFDKKERVAQTRQLRSVLLHHPEFLFISTTPTRYLRGLSDPKEPLYGHLKERELTPLTEEEVRTLYEKLAKQMERKDLEAVFQGREGGLRLRVVHQLTGGLPRSVLMAFTVMQGEAGIGSIVEGMRRFLDTQTAYFEARLARLSPRERAIITTMALARENLTAKEIAQASRLPERSLSTHIQRLTNDGHIRLVEGSSGKGTLYMLSEGLFRLWYQYRRGLLLLEPLVSFIANWFPIENIEEMIRRLQEQLDTAPPIRKRFLEINQLQLQEALRQAISPEGKKKREILWTTEHAADTSTPLSPTPVSWTELQAAVTRLKKTIEHSPAGTQSQYRDMLAALAIFLAVTEDAEAQKQTQLLHPLLSATTEILLAEQELNKKNHKQAQERFRGVVESFKNHQNPFIQYLVAIAQAALIPAWGEAPESRRIKIITGWLDKYTNSLASTLAPHMLLDRALSFIFEEQPSRALHDINHALEKIYYDPQNTADAFLHGSSIFLAVFGPTQFLKWLATLEDVAESDSLKRQLELNKLAAKLLLSEGVGSRKGSRTSRQQMELLRIPPELRTPLQEIVRETIRLRKRLGATWEDAPSEQKR